MKRNLLKSMLGGLCLTAMLLASNSSKAITINDPDVVGIIVSGEPASIANEADWVNQLLALGANAVNVPSVPAGHLLSTSSTDYNGSVSAVGAFKINNGDAGFSLNVSGYQYVLAKYNGPNGGDVVYYLNGAAFTLPGNSDLLWENRSGQGYAISHWTGFGRTENVPDGGATITLLGMALAGVGFVRSKMVKA